MLGGAAYAADFAGLQTARAVDFKAALAADKTFAAPLPAASDKAFKKTAICRDTFVTMMNQLAEQALPEQKIMFEGINTSDQKVCSMEITYKETPERNGVINIYVPTSPHLNPFNHPVPTANGDAYCSADGTSVSAKYSWREDYGWHHKYTTELTIAKLSDGQLKLTYRQNKGEELTCVGTIR
jgi:hypothetical protein